MTSSAPTSSDGASPRDPALFVALLVGAFFIFWRWLDTEVASRALAVNQRQLCWWFWQRCDVLALEDYPRSGTLSAVYVVLFALLVAAGTAAARARWRAARGLMAALLSAELLGLLASARHGTPAMMGHAALLAAWVMVPAPARVAPWIIAVVSTASVLPKLDADWLLGAMPSPLLAVLVVLVEGVVPWLVAGARGVSRRSASFALVTYYVLAAWGDPLPALALAPVVIALASDSQAQRSPSRSGWALLGVLVATCVVLALHGAPVTMSRGDVRCVSQATIIEEGGATPLDVPLLATDACDRWAHWYAVRYQCELRRPARLAWTFTRAYGERPARVELASDDACRLVQR